ncbi:MAG TPA: amylo-alpha-1,6-glucosidase [Terriglobales bacterium]|nr:amylo-alpha-1,6-glucosidase [Terriglobales bacterium]
MTSSAFAGDSQTRMELSRPVRSWEFLPEVGTRAGLFGNENGNLEAWVYPLKILRNFHLNFLIDGQAIPAESLSRTLIVHPESSTIVYSGNTFSVRETLFVPVKEQGAIIHFEVNTAEPLEIEAVFERDFQLEWPAALGGTFLYWDPSLHAFHLGEEQKKYVALVGSPSADQERLEYETNYSASNKNSFRLGVTAKGIDTKTITIAASTQGQADAEKTYRKLENSYSDLLQESSDYYHKYLERTVQLELPDSQLQQAYDWSRVSMLQGLVTNPDLGTGLIAGYRTSFDSQRPGFAWFFGRDSMWTSLALDASGDFTTTKTALEFLAKFQRADGKIPHEISQAANLVPWFDNVPYGFASADATPLFIITANDYVTHSGDVAFINEKWDNLWRAYQFLRSTYDQQGLPQNFGFGHGWIEGGPLLPVKSEMYQAGVGAEALRSLANLARLAGKNDVSAQLDQEFTAHKAALNQAFWSTEKNYLAYAVDANSQRLDVPSVLTTVPMWFGLTDNDKSQKTIDELSNAGHQADWGMRIISSHDSNYNPGGYHFGSVWPLFTGWASVGEYKYHRVHSAYANLRANALLALDGSLGHATEVLSGDYYQPLSTSSPHQIWSAAMVVSPILRGMLGLEVDAIAHQVTFTPHVPADWNFFRIRNVRVGDVVLDLIYRKSADGIGLEVQRTGSGDCTIEFSPALSPRARIVRVTLDGRAIANHLENHGTDQHATVQIPANRAGTLQIRTKDDFGYSVDSHLPALGSSSQGLRVVSESWNGSSLDLDVEGKAGNQYAVNLWNPNQISSVDGGVISKEKLMISFPSANADAYAHQKVTLHFAK